MLCRWNYSGVKLCHKVYFARLGQTAKYFWRIFSVFEIGISRIQQNIFYNVSHVTIFSSLHFVCRLNISRWLLKPVISVKGNTALLLWWSWMFFARNVWCPVFISKDILKVAPCYPQICDIIICHLLTYLLQGAGSFLRS